jgi:26S proteasome regulatory subunit N1
MLNTGIQMEGDFALSLLGEYTENKSVPLKTSAFMGLALAYYTGSHREDFLAYLLQHVADDTITMEISGLAALALVFIFVGSKHGEVSEVILQTSMEKYASEHAFPGLWQ